MVNQVHSKESVRAIKAVACSEVAINDIKEDAVAKEQTKCKLNELRRKKLELVSRLTTAKGELASKRFQLEQSRANLHTS